MAEYLILLYRISYLPFFSLLPYISVLTPTLYICFFSSVESRTRGAGPRESRSRTLRRREWRLRSKQTLEKSYFHFLFKSPSSEFIMLSRNASKLLRRSYSRIISSRRDFASANETGMSLRSTIFRLSCYSCRRKVNGNVSISLWHNCKRFLCFIPDCVRFNFYAI